jgi:choline dehydrogenase-like flavoprotein
MTSRRTRSRPCSRTVGALACTGARAEGIAMRVARATAVEARTRAGGRVTVEADTVVVAAGTIHTPLLWAANGLGRGAALGRHLSVHPATAVWGVFDEPVDMVRGVPRWPPP